MSVPNPPPDPDPNLFSSADLQRRAELRSDVAWLAAALADPGCRVVVARGGLQLAQRDFGQLTMLGSAHPQIRQADDRHFSLLGWFRGSPCLLLDVTDSEFEPPAGASFEETRGLLSLLSAGEASVALMARGLQLWRPRHRHCGVCGALTAPRNAGHSLRCTNSGCAAEFFPRIDPAVIVAVSDGPHVLLGRQPSWPAGRYSTLAGFVEVGESLEDAVIREVREEAGVDCHAPRYFGSQAWPFPGSLMLGFHASAAHALITLDEELEDARWFSPAELAHMPSALLPPPFTIARRLINHWYRGVTGRELDDPY
jgi:NAD+ diphosphatase